MEKYSKILSFLKAISWRAFGTLATLVLAFFLTGDFALSTKFCIIEFSLKIVLFYLHERIWQINLKSWRKKFTNKWVS